MVRKMSRALKEDIMQLAEDLYCYEWTNPFENNCNSYYIGGTARVLIDPGLSLHLDALFQRMRNDGIDPDEISTVLATHSHPDHFEGVCRFSSSSSVTIALHEAEKAFLDTVGRDMYRLFGLSVPSVTVDLVLNEGDIRLGTEDFSILHVPGHSPGSIALYWPAQKALFSGDVIFYQNVGRTDFPGGDSTLLKESIRRLATLGTEYLLPGHMNFIHGHDEVRSNFDLVIDRVFPYL